MREDKTIARKLVAAEIDETLKTMRGIAAEVTVVGYRDGNVTGALPEGDGTGTMIPIHFGQRGNLSKSEAKSAGKTWREITRRYPKAFFTIGLLGYDEDPRPIWEITEAARYVRWWARYAGLDDIEVADRLIGEGSALAQLGPEYGRGYLSLLAACGVFGNEVRQEVIKDFQPTWS